MLIESLSEIVNGINFRADQEKLGSRFKVTIFSGDDVLCSEFGDGEFYLPAYLQIKAKEFIGNKDLNCNKTNLLPNSEADETVEQAESDPTGRGAHEAGAKLDSGKLYAGLVLGDFANALKYVAEVGTFGANKYSKSGWLSVPDGQSRYEDANVRHWLSRMAGEILDPDSNLLHLGHEAWNSLAKLELYLRKQNEVEEYYNTIEKMK